MESFKGTQMKKSKSCVSDITSLGYSKEWKISVKL